MLIQVGNRLCSAKTANQGEAYALIDILTVTESKPDFATGEKHQSFHYQVAPPTPGETGVFSTIMFRAGLVSLVHQRLTEAMVEITYEDKREHIPGPVQYPDCVKQFSPYPDQAEIARVMALATRGVLNLCTGYGKTYLIGEFWDLIHRPQMLVLVPSVALLHQTSEDLEDMYGMEEGSIGKVGGGKHDWKPVTVAVSNSAATYVEHNGKFPLAFNVLIADEGHTQVGKYAQLVADNCNALYRFWISGTAAKTDTVNPLAYEFTLTGLAGGLIADVRTSELVESGRLKRPLIRFIDNAVVYDTSDATEEPQQYRLLKTDEDRNDLVASLAREAVDSGLSVLIFVEHIKHGEAIQDLLGRNTVKFVRGGKGRDNDHIRGLLKDGVIKCVVCTSAWRMGVSVPAIDVIINAAGKKSMYLLMQLFGRLLRQSELGYGYFIDFMDRGMKYPQRQAQARLDAFVKEGLPVNIVKDRRLVFDPTEGHYDMFGKVC